VNGAAFAEPTRILAIRHGETAWNVGNRIQGQLDVPLNDTGRWQARRLGAALADETIDVVYTSDLARAHETALALAGAGASADATRPLVADTGLRERHFGRFEGRTWSEIETDWPVESERWRRRDPAFGPEGGETLTQFYERAVGTATRLASAHPGQTIALVAHGGVMDCLYRAAARVGLQAPRSWQLGNASLNRLLHTPDGFTLVGWSDTSHLDDEALDESNDRVGHAA
jgi:2,3-bisphosphoglycerate-dependent phosphoglycerate mutase